MKNYEKYGDTIRKYRGSDICDDIVKPYILKSDNCNGISCGACHMLQMIWLMEEYEEPEVDWSEVEVDTPILVKHNEAEEWARRYFAKYENGAVYAWDFGRTSWNETIMVEWEYAKLAEIEEGGAE